MVIKSNINQKVTNNQQLVNWKFQKEEKSN